MKALRMALICAGLVVATMAVYWQTTSFDFVALDDPPNVFENKLVTGGITLDSIIWACRTSAPDYWRPLTWLSLMLDHELYQLNPHGYHLTNILLHTINVLLLLGAMRSLTGATWRSAFVAGAFALHPLHVESVAWITERKDVLGGCFGLMAFWAYSEYAQRGGGFRYLLTAGFLGLSLMAKPLLVTAPLVFLLLDVWPLRRLEINAGWKHFWTSARQPMLEKLPLLIISAASCVMTMRGGAQSIIEVPASLRLTNAFMNYAQYVDKLVWPMNLAAYYPYPGMYSAASWAAWQVAIGTGALIGISIVAVMMRRQRPYLLVGWLWFLGMLVPVIGFLQVGSQGWADRFVYFPFVGLYIILAWGLGEVALRWPRLKPVCAAIAVAGLAGWGCVAFVQARYWRNTDALYGHTLAVTANNYKVQDFYGGYLYQGNRNDEAIPHYEEAVKLAPGESTAHFNLGLVYLKAYRNLEAIHEFRQALELGPNNADAHYNICMAQCRRGEYDEALKEVQAAIALSPVHRSDYLAALSEIQARRAARN